MIPKKFSAPDQRAELTSGPRALGQFLPNTKQTNLNTFLPSLPGPFLKASASNSQHKFRDSHAARSWAGDRLPPLCRPFTAGTMSTSPNDGRPGGLQEALLDFVLSFSLGQSSNGQSRMHKTSGLWRVVCVHGDWAFHTQPPRSRRLCSY